MEIIVKKLIDFDILERAASFTSGKETKLKDNAAKWYASEHSPIRTQMFWVEMYDIPTFVSVHFVRHKHGIEHFVKSNREDSGSDFIADRNTLINHAMMINAQALINIARKRLCGKASDETMQVMIEIKKQIKEIDPALAKAMVKECVYRGKCNEFKTCHGGQTDSD